MLTGAGIDVLRDLSGAATGSLISAVWQGALLAGAAALGLRMLPKTPAAARFAIWFSVFLVLAALPFAGVWTHPIAAQRAFTGSGAAWLTLDNRWSEGALLLWAAVSLVRLVLLAVGAVRVRSLWKRATPIADAGMIAEAGAQNAFGRTTQICTSDEVDRPSVIGFFAPKILIPAWLVEKLTPEEMSQVVLHEAGHLRRADDWLNLVQKIALVLFPLNPALAWVERRLCFERELACDERVLRATGAPKAYASCLTSLAEHRMTRRGMALVMGALGRESELGQRVRRILARGEHMRPAHARLVMGGAVCALIAGAAGLEHCPQLVGFSAAQETVAAKAPVGTGLHYQDVVYRPGVAGRMQLRAVDTVVRQPIAAAVSEKVPVKGAIRRGERPGVGMLANTAPRVPFTQQVSMTRTPDGDFAGARQAANGVVATEWVVMTSWSADAGSYGARVVMTSIATGPAPQPSPNASAPVHGEDGDALAAAPARRTAAVQRAPTLRQFSPYAAVPVRGGWLVIQL